MRDLMIKGKDVRDELLEFARDLVRIRSYSGQEEQVARFIASKMESLGYDEVRIDGIGNVLGRIGNGRKVILFDSHIDTVNVDDEDLWAVPPFSGEILDGFLWGRGSVDMKSGVAAAVFAAAVAKSLERVTGKTVYVSCTVFEEDCDGEGLRQLLKESRLKPGYAVICEPSGNAIVTGQKGKAQIIIRTRGVSTHSSAPEKGKNAIYAMAGIIQRVEQANLELMKKDGRRGSLVLSRISSKSVSINAVPSECEVYLDRRMVAGDTAQTIRDEMEKVIAGIDAEWEMDILHRTTWTGAELIYDPFHLAWEISADHDLSRAFLKAYHAVFGDTPEKFDFWDFSTNAVALVDLGIPTIGFGPGEYKLAHMRDEKCATSQITDACSVYLEVIDRL